MHQHRRKILIGAMTVLATACAVSTQQEVQIGQQASQQVEQQMQVVHDPVVEQYMASLGNLLASHTSRSDLEWHFALVNTNVVNAFALPGGFIYVNRGIVERADKMDELAGVMAHEIGHVVLRHSVKQMQQMQAANVGVGLGCILTRICESQAGAAAVNVGGSLVFAKFSREDETQADESGFQTLMASGISPEGQVSFFQKLLDEEARAGGEPSGLNAWFTDHPLTQDRITDIQRLINTVPPQKLGTLTTDSPAFHTFKQRVHSLPAPPKGQ